MNSSAKTVIKKYKKRTTSWCAPRKVKAINVREKSDKKIVEDPKPKKVCRRKKSSSKKSSPPKIVNRRQPRCKTVKSSTKKIDSPLERVCVSKKFGDIFQTDSSIKNRRKLLCGASKRIMELAKPKNVLISERLAENQKYPVETNSYPVKSNRSTRREVLPSPKDFELFLEKLYQSRMKSSVEKNLY